MTNSTSLPDEIPASLSFDVKYMHRGKYSIVLFLPEAYHALIGLVVAYWGNFEVVFDFCLEGLIAGEVADGKTRETSRWKHQNFKNRRKLFKEICDGWLTAWKPEAAQKLISILDSASHLHSRRNLIAHGTYGYSIPAKSSVARDCYAFNNSTKEKMLFDERILKKIYHDISHLTADLINAFQSFGEVEGPFYMLPDAEILRVYRETVHPWNPNPKKRPGVV
jgi:hypothetical protein